MIELLKTEQIKTTYRNERLDFDRYDIEVKSQLSNKEISIIVDFVNEEITGDCVGYGSWYEIEIDECIELLEKIKNNNKPLRDFSHIIKKIKKGRR